MVEETGVPRENRRYVIRAETPVLKESLITTWLRRQVIEPVGDVEKE
jgi:hypothetical protein